MAETKRRQRWRLVLPVELAESLLTNRTKRDILQNTLDTLLGSGVDISTEVAVNYLRELTDATISFHLAYNADMRTVLALAVDRAGYDPETCTPIQDDLLETTGAVFWTGPVEGAA